MIFEQYVPNYNSIDDWPLLIEFNSLDELLNLDVVKSYKEDLGNCKFSHFSVIQNYPTFNEASLIAEYNKQGVNICVGFIQNPTNEFLSKFEKSNSIVKKN